MNRLMIWREGAAKWCVGGGLVCLASSCGSSGRPAGGWKAHCALQMVHASGLEEGEGDGDGQAHKDCLHPPPSPIDPHGSTATEESPGCGAGGREGGGEVIYVQLGYIVKVRASGRGKNDF